MQISTANLINIVIHIVAGTLGLGIGFVLLAKVKGDANHKKWGRIFAYCAIIVCVSAAVGVIFFRFMPLFAVLTVLVLYQVISGWRAVKTKKSGLQAFDAIWTLLTIVGSIALVPTLIANINLTSPSVLYSTLGALGIVLAYDTIRWFFPKHWHQTLWQYEHLYKILSTLFGMLSAFVGNVIRFGQPWSQMLPSLIGSILILWFFIKIYRNERKTLNIEVKEHIA